VKTENQGGGREDQNGKIRGVKYVGVRQRKAEKKGGTYLKTKRLPHGHGPFQNEEIGFLQTGRWGQGILHRTEPRLPAKGRSKNWKAEKKGRSRIGAR